MSTLLGERVKLARPLLGIAHNDGARSLLTVPQNTIVRIPSNINGDDRFVTVMWKGKTLQLFLSDVKEHGIGMSE